MMPVETLRRDVMPAEVACPDGSVIQRCRAFATSHRLIVWGEAEHKRVTLLDIPLSEDCVPGDRGTLRGAIECLTADGTYWVNRGRGCGCGQTTLRALGPPVSWTGEKQAA